MSLREIRGHEGLRDRLAAVIAANRFPQSSLLIGPAGVGKQRLALWVAQTLLCEARAPRGPCGRCSACRRVLDLSHPDVHWFIPIPHPTATDPSKQIDEAETLLGEVLVARRAEPPYQRPRRSPKPVLTSP